MKGREFDVVYLHNKFHATRELTERKGEIVRQIAAIELLIQKGVTGQWVINRLKDLAEELK